MERSLTIRPAGNGGPERAAIEALHRHAFGDHGDKIVALVRLLERTAAGIGPVSLVAVRNGEIVGHVLLSAAHVDATRALVDVFTLSPLAVDPRHQRQGIGLRLIASALEEAARLNVPLVFLEGPPDYYARAGFKRASALGYRSPSLRIPDPAFQVAVLTPFEPWMVGTFVYSEPFWALDCVGLR